MFTTFPITDHYYRFKRRDVATIISGRYKGHTDVVDSPVFKRTVDRPDEFAPGYHVALDTEPVVTVWREQLRGGTTRNDIKRVAYQKELINWHRAPLNRSVVGIYFPCNSFCLRVNLFWFKKV